MQVQVLVRVHSLEVVELAQGLVPASVQFLEYQPWQDLGVLWMVPDMQT